MSFDRNHHCFRLVRLLSLDLIRGLVSLIRMLVSLLLSHWSQYRIRRRSYVFVLQIKHRWVQHDKYFTFFKSSYLRNKTWGSSLCSHQGSTWSDHKPHESAENYSNSRSLNLITAIERFKENFCKFASYHLLRFVPLGEISSRPPYASSSPPLSPYFPSEIFNSFHYSRTYYLAVETITPVTFEIYRR